MRSEPFQRMLLDCVVALAFAAVTSPAVASHSTLTFDESASGIEAHIGPYVENPIIQTSEDTATVQALIRLVGVSPMSPDPRAAVVLFEPQAGLPPESSLVGHVITQDFLGLFPNPSGVGDDLPLYRWAFYAYPIAPLVDLAQYAVAYVAETPDSWCGGSNAPPGVCLAPFGFFDLTEAIGNGLDSVRIQVRVELAEPATLALLAICLAVLCLGGRRRA